MEIPKVFEGHELKVIKMVEIVLKILLAIMGFILIGLEILLWEMMGEMTVDRFHKTIGVIFLISLLALQGLIVWIIFSRVEWEASD